MYIINPSTEVKVAKQDSKTGRLSPWVNHTTRSAVILDVCESKSSGCCFFRHKGYLIWADAKDVRVEIPEPEAITLACGLCGGVFFFKYVNDFSFTRPHCPDCHSSQSSQANPSFRRSSKDVSSPSCSDSQSSSQAGEQKTLSFSD